MMKLKMSMVKSIWSVRRFIIAWIIPIVLLPVPIAVPTQIGKCAYVVLLMAFYWFTEAMPLAITSLIPIVFFPLFGIMSSDVTCKAYMNGTLMIFLGSLIAAAAVESSGLHQRIALRVLLLFGTSPKRLLLGFMLNTAFLSMWISNLAACTLMIPIINASLDQLRQKKPILSYDQPNEQIVSIETGDRKSDNNNHVNQVEDKERIAFLKVRKALFLGVCYSANIGGTGTLTGTSTNLILNGILKENPVSFSDWIIFNVPGMVLLIILAWIFVIFYFLRNTDSLSDAIDKEVIDKTIRKKYEQLGHIKFNETAVLVLFSMMLLLWFFRDPDFLLGWAPRIVNQENFIKDSTPAIFVVFFFFLIPAKPTQLRTSPMLLDWKTTQDSVSWGIILMLGGGFALAQGSEASGLSHWIGDQLVILEHLPKFIISVIVCLFALMLTEIASNSATCAILLPVIKRMAITLGLNPLSIMLPVTVSCSYAFMLPVATGPNAIVFEAAKLKTKEMAIPGAILKIICLVVILIMVNSWGKIVLNFDKFIDPNLLKNQTLNFTIGH